MMKKNTIGLFIFNLINTGTQFLLIIILSRFFSKNEYATFRQLFLTFEIAAPLLGLGLSNAIFYFYPRYQNKKEILYNALLLIFLICVIFELILVFFLGDFIAGSFNNPSLNNYFFYLGIFAFFSVSNTVLYSFFILENKIKTSIVINSVFNVLLLILLYVITLFSGNLENVVQLRVIVYGFMFLLMLYNSKLGLKYLFSKKNNTIQLKTILRYSFPIALSLLIGVFSYNLDKLIVSSFCNAEEYAIYINGAFEIPLIGIITSSIASASFGLFTNYCKENKFNYANELFKKVSVASSIIIFPCFFLCFFFAKEIIVLMFGNNYIDSYFIFRVYLLLLPIRIVQYGNVLIALGKSNVLLYRSLTELLISGVLGVLFFYSFGYRGVVFAPVIAILFWSVPYNLVIISKGFGLSVFSIVPFKKLFIVVMSCFISIVFLYILNVLFHGILPLYKIVIGTLIFGLIYLGSIYKFRIISFDFNNKYKIKLL